MKDMGDDLREIARSRERTWVSVYRVYPTGNYLDECIHGAGTD